MFYAQKKILIMEWKKIEYSFSLLYMDFIYSVVMHQYCPQRILNKNVRFDCALGPRGQFRISN
jgi:hypothetical protein